MSASDRTGTSDEDHIRNCFAWLADAPLFIDGEQVDAFYDAVVRPEGKAGRRCSRRRAPRPTSDRDRPRSG